MIYVAQRTVLGSDANSSRVVLLSRSNMVEKVHLRAWVQDMPTTLASLYCWDVVSYGSAETSRRSLFNVACIDEIPLLLPIAADAFQRPPLVEGPAAYSALALKFPCDEVSVSVLGAIRNLQGEERRLEAVPFEALDGHHIGDINALANAGALVLSTDEFGSVMVSSDASQTKYISVTSHGNPQQVVNLARFCVESKLDLVITLLRRGWGVHTKPTHPYGMGARPERVFIASFQKPASYFTCLVLVEELFARGVTHIPHFEKDLYYQCLLRLRGDKLKAFITSGQFDKAWCKQMLRSPEAEFPLHDAPPLEPDPDDVDDDAEDAEPRPLALLPAMLDRMKWHRVKVQGIKGSVRVFFDNFTGGGITQRSWANCSGAHDHCFQWRQCDDFACRDDLARYMYTWATSHECCEDRASHQSYRPSASDVELIGCVQIAEF
jgi:hypothetical protein